MEGAELGLLQARVQLHLIDRRPAPRLSLQQLEPLGAEVGDADSASGLLPVNPFQRLPGAEQSLRLDAGTVDQASVDVVEPEPLEARLEGVEGRLRIALKIRELAGDEVVLAGKAGGHERLAHLPLVAVRGCGVEMAVTGLERLLDDAPGLRGRHLEESQPELRNLDAIVKGNSGGLCLGRIHFLS